jgi:ATP-dependent Clp protease ATP-binding subunit ClpA
MDSIVTKFMVELDEQLAARSVTIALTAEAKAWLAEKGYDPDHGARPLARVIQNEIKKRLGDELLFGKLEHGGKVDVGVAEGELSFAFTAATKPASPAAATTALAVPPKVKSATPAGGTKKPVLN